jgi:hypothetical protein
MQNIGVTLTPGLPSQFQMKGTVLQILSSGNSAGLTVQFIKGSQVAYTLEDVLTGWKITPPGGFDSITIESATGDTISGIITGGDVDIQILTLNAEIVNSSANPVPVSLVSEPGQPVQVSITGVTSGNPLPVAIDGGTLTLTATNVGINNTSANPVPVQLQTDAEASPIPVSGTVTIGNAAGSPVPVSLVSEPGAPVAVTITGSTDATAIPVQAQPIATTPTDLTPLAITGGNPWAQSTAYAVNAYAQANGNLYKCTTAGTSAASGAGPAATTAGIADGSAVWAYQSTASVALVAASAARKGLRFRNQGPGQIALTAAAATMFQNAAVVLQVGDVWNENEAPGAAWFATSNASATITAQAVQ